MLGGLGRFKASAVQRLGLLPLATRAASPPSLGAMGWDLWGLSSDYS